MRRKGNSALLSNHNLSYVSPLPPHFSRSSRLDFAYYAHGNWRYPSRKALVSLSRIFYTWYWIRISTSYFLFYLIQNQWEKLDQDDKKLVLIIDRFDVSRKIFAKFLCSGQSQFHSTSYLLPCLFKLILGGEIDAVFLTWVVQQVTAHHNFER